MANVEQVAALQTQLARVQAQLAAATERAASMDQTSAELEANRIESGKQQQELRVREALLAEAQKQQEQSCLELATAREQLLEAEAQLAIARQRQEELRQEAAAANNAAAASSTGERDQNQEVARLREALNAAHAESERLAAQLKDAPAAGDADEVKKLRKERDSLRRKLTETENKLAETAQGEQDGQHQEDLKRRLELAMDELRETKRANAELETKLKSKGAGVVAIGVGSGALDWEAQKQRLLASLEADDVDQRDEDAVEERQSIENTIELTDRVVAEKDAEIEALRRQLESGAAGGASTAAAVSELLDSDEIIRAEREKLAQAQAEWRERIGKAEIDISMERAKIARERMELEERMRHYQDERPEESADTSSEKSGKPVRGRWLTRLGLKDLTEE
jgi:chromosome segregation ATPase